MLYSLLIDDLESSTCGDYESDSYSIVEKSADSAVEDASVVVDRKSSGGVAYEYIGSVQQSSSNITLGSGRPPLPPPQSSTKHVSKTYDDEDEEVIMPSTR